MLTCIPYLCTSAGGSLNFVAWKYNNVDGWNVYVTYLLVSRSDVDNNKARAHLGLCGRAAFALHNPLLCIRVCGSFDRLGRYAYGGCGLICYWCGWYKGGKEGGLLLVLHLINPDRSPRDTILHPDFDCSGLSRLVA